MVVAHFKLPGGQKKVMRDITQNFNLTPIPMTAHAIMGVPNTGMAGSNPSLGTDAL